MCSDYDPEDAADIAAYDRAKARIASGEVGFVPFETVKRMLDGENKVRVWREHCGMSLVDLADAASIDVGRLSQIEDGRVKSDDEIARLAKALRVLTENLS